MNIEYSLVGENNDNSFQRGISAKISDVRYDFFYHKLTFLVAIKQLLKINRVPRKCKRRSSSEIESKQNVYVYFHHIRQQMSH